MTDQSAAVIVDAEVEIRNVETNLSVIVKTNQDGLYTIPALHPGHYVISARKPGFKAVTVTQLELNVQDNVVRNFALQVGSIAESVTITADSLNINTTDGTVGTLVGRQFVENMPLNGRSFQSLITLVPGVVAVPGASTGSKGEFSVNGQRTEANYYTVDGVSANTGSVANAAAAGASGSLPGQTALGTTQSLVSLDALQEFRIQTSTYSAEYGRTPGAQISLVTRSGTNDWHGSAYDYLRNGALDANNWFNNFNHLPKTAERQNDFGGSLGGPIIIPWLYKGRDKTFFFFSYEGMRLTTPQPARTALVPDLCLRGVSAQCIGTDKPAPAVLQPYLNAYPVPNGAENGTTGLAQFTFAYSVPANLDSTSIRLDHNFSSKFTVFARYSDSPSQSTVRGPVNFAPSVVQPTLVMVRTVTAGASNMLTSHLFNQLRFNYTWNESRSDYLLDNFGGAVPFALASVKDSTGQPIPNLDSFSVNVQLSGVNLVAMIPNQAAKQRQANVVDTWSYSVGRHALKFGMDYRQLNMPLSFSHFGLEDFLTSKAQLQNNTGALFLMAQAAIPEEPTYRNLSLFIQDEWKAMQRLNLSLGLRWELNPPPTDGFGNLPYTLKETTNLATAALAPKGTPLWNTTYGNFAPRVGAAYKLRQATGHETVVRGGFGLFYDLGNTFASTGYSSIGFAVTSSLGNTPFPPTPSQLVLPPPSIAAPYGSTVTGFDRDLQLPYALQWNAAVEQALGPNQALTIGYVGSAGRRLLFNRLILPRTLGNTNFLSGLSGQLNFVTNQGTSDYDALQVQFQRRVSHGLQALTSYSWSHSIDDASVNQLNTTILLRGSSNFDVRQNFQAAVTYDVPSPSGNHLISAPLRHWSLDSRVAGRSSLPFDVFAANFTDPVTGRFTALRPDLVPGQPIYVSNPTAPGGRVVNFNAFTIPTAAEQAAGQFGNTPRNFVRGFDAWQLDFGVRREFPIHERVKLQFRGEAFNVFNHPIFGAITTTLPSGAALFGRATGTLNNQLGGLNPLYQQGGPRSLQLSLRVVF